MAMKQENIVGRILTADVDTYAPALYKADDYFIVPPVLSEDYINTLLNICLENNVSAVIPLIDTELMILADHKSVFEQHGIKLLVSDQRTVNICADKYLTYEFFKQAGFATPETLLPGKDAMTLSFPVFLKPRFGSASIDTFKIYDQDELNVFVKRVKEPVIQEFIEGKEYTIDVFCDFVGRPIYVTPRLRLAVRGGEVSKGRVEKNTKLIKTVERMVSELNVCGPLTVQCICSEGQYVFTEINGRFAGGSPISIKAGADAPAALYRMLRGDEVTPDIYGFEDGLVALRYDQAIYLKQ
ncbi:MAG: carbamoyl-phosphate synthase large subunit [Clostridiales bacterium]|nr:carbamoyl-phosphate synthase large subunit [Clostridiales bacterium]